MGGKTKQSQRTKNNARPSSSWRSAELLTQSVGFGGVVAPGGGAQASLFTTLTENTIQTLANEFVLCLKKLNKKDPISKTKGLQELSDVVKQSSSEQMAEFVQHWSRLYPMLSNDVDHKVREATQLCHGAVCVASGRMLARVLRCIAPAWLCAQYDAYPPAAAHARHTLASTFPGEKMHDLLQYTCNDLLTYIITNVIHNDEENMRRHEESAESSQARYTALCVCSLRAVRLVAETLQWAHVAQLPANGKYWKLPNTPALRSAWLDATTAMLECFPEQFAAEYGSRCAKYLLMDAKCDTNAWQCLLLLLKHTQSNSVWQEKGKELTNRMMELAEDGGAGTSALLLPVVAAMPVHMRTEHTCTQYVNAMLRGVDKKCIITSKSERLARVVAIGDCLEYMVGWLSGQVVVRLHRLWLLCALCVWRRGPARAHVVAATAGRVAGTLRTWTNAGRDTHVRQLWHTIASVMWSTISRANPRHLTRLTEIAADHSAFLMAIADPTSLPDKPAKCITFDDQQTNNDTTNATIAHNTTHVGAAAPVCAQYDHDATALTTTVILKHFEYVAAHKAAMSAVLPPLTGVLRMCRRDDMHARLAAHLGCESPLALCITMMGWLDDVEVCCARACVDVLVIVMGQLSAEHRRQALEHVAQLGQRASELFVCACVRACVGGEDGAWCAEWLRGAAGEILRRAAERGGTGDAAIEHAFTHDKHGELLVSGGAVGGVMVALVSRVRRGEECAVALGGMALAAAADIVTHTEVQQPYEALLAQMFTLALQRESSASDAEWCWRDALWCVAAKSAACATRVTQTLANIAKQQLLSAECDINEIDRIATICGHMMDTEARDLPALANTLDMLANDEHEPMQTLAVHYDCIISKLNCLCADVERACVPTVSAMSGYCTQIAFRAILVKNVLLGPKHGTSDTCARDHCTRALTTETRLCQHYLKLLHAAVVCETLRHALVYSYDHHALLHRASECVYACVELIVSALSTESLSALTRALDTHRPLGLHWAYCAKLLHQLSQNDNAHDDNTEHESYYHTLQANGDTRKYELIALYNLEKTYPVQCASIEYTSGVMDYVVELYYKCEEVMLLDRDLCGSTWQQVVCVAAVVECMQWHVESGGWQMSAAQWDFVNIALCGLINSLRMSARPQHAAVAMLCRCTLSLLRCVATFVSQVPAKCMQQQPLAHVAQLPHEWADVFEPNIAENMFHILMDALNGAVDVTVMSPPLHVYMCALLTTLPHMRHAALPPPRRTAAAAFSPHALVDACARTLTTPHHHHIYKYMSYNLLTHLTDTLLQYDSKSLSISNSEEYDDDSADVVTQDAIEGCFVSRCLSAHHTIYEQLSTLGREQLLSAEGDGAALGAILLTHALVGVTLAAKGDLALLYVRAYCQNKMVTELLELSLRLLPDEPHASMFGTETREQLRSPTDGALLGALSCRSVWLAAQCKAAAGDADIDELVTRHVSPAVIRQHLNECATLGDDELQVTVLASTREVQCTRKLDDGEARLTITLSPAHPLRAPRVHVHCGPQLHPHQHFLAHQRGNVRSAVLWWAATVTKWVSRAPLCCVCYCRLQGGRLPQAGCKVCKHKFHAPCLQKWFNTSKDPKCPLCRSPFVNHSMYNGNRAHIAH